MTVPADELRAWAEGDYPTEAAVELLIRAKGGRFARVSCPWIEPTGPSSSLYRADWDRLREESGVFSGGERRFLNIAISMGSPDHPVDLSNNLSGLDDELLLLALAATAHASQAPTAGTGLDRRRLARPGSEEACPVLSRAAYRLDVEMQQKVHDIPLGTLIDHRGERRCRK